ncbi:MAG: peptidase signal peptidase [Actinomycetia bacterium]|nr:peptidase signal peptidase [Actinomycetes bacterium]
MGRQQRRLLKAAGVILVIAGLAVVAMLWPARLGGSVSYATTGGSSMEPVIHQGDLVLVRHSSSYKVGDVVAYRSRVLDTTVLHRIVARRGAQYIFKGDKNGWLDADHPTRRDLLGKEWIRIPDGGRALAWFRTPGGWVIGVALLLLITSFAVNERNRKRSLSLIANESRRPHPTRAWLAAAAVCAAVTLTSLATIGVAFARPLTGPAARPLTYSQHGRFTYSAPVPPGPVYSGSSLATGDPVFLQVVPSVTVAFEYQFVAAAPRASTGTIELAAQVSNASGWRRTIQLAPPSPFTGDHASLEAVLDTVAIRRLVTDVATATGIPDAVSTVTLVPTVHIAGTLAAHKLKAVFSPRLSFSLDRTQLRLAQSAPARTANAALNPTSTAHVRQISTVPRSLHLAGRGATVRDVRTTAVVVASTFGLLTIGCLVALRRRWNGASSRIELRLGHRLVPAAPHQPQAKNGVVDVTRIEDLVRLADQHGCLILHAQTDHGHVYLFHADRLSYRYVLDEPPTRENERQARNPSYRGAQVNTAVPRPA